MALKQHTAELTEKYDHLSVEYTKLKADHEQLRQMVMNVATEFLTHVLINFQKKPKIENTMKIQKNMVFNIFSSF